MANLELPKDPSAGRIGRISVRCAAIESFWVRLKVEIAWIRGSIRFDTRAEAHAYLFEFIEVFYNRHRHQATLDPSRVPSTLATTPPAMNPTKQNPGPEIRVNITLRA
jgi:Integrase core domain